NLLRVGIQSIVRLGSRSKSEIIKGFNLEEICRNRARSKHQGWLLAQGYKELGEIQTEAEKLQSNLTNKELDWKWKQARNKRKKKRSIFRQWVDGNDLSLAQTWADGLRDKK
ncbi:24105_t:CDS:2, partial [Gigaspora margarita]